MAEHPHAALARKGYEAFNRQDMDALRELLAGDATHHVPGDNPLSGDYKGQDAILEMYRRLAEDTNGTFRVELHDLLVDGRGHVMSHHRMTGERGGRTLDMRGGVVFRVIGDKITDLDECVEDLDGINEFWA